MAKKKTLREQQWELDLMGWLEDPRAQRVLFEFLCWSGVYTTLAPRAEHGGPIDPNQVLINEGMRQGALWWMQKIGEVCGGEVMHAVHAEGLKARARQEADRDERRSSDLDDTGDDASDDAGGE